MYRASVDRRLAILGGASALIPHSAISAMAAPATTPPSPIGRYDPEKEMSPADLILHCTVRLEFDLGNGVRSGTGFFFGFFPRSDKQSATLAIISNKHVFLGEDYLRNPDYRDARIRLILQDERGAPTSEILDMTLIGTRDNLILHPNADLAALMFGGYFDTIVKKNKQPFIVNLLPENVASAHLVRSLTPLEGVVTVGYPGQFWDYVNDLPLLHRGSTASPINVDFQGRKEFLVDFTTWPGASGSPVFLYEEGVWYSGRTKQYTLGGLRLNFVGVVYGVGAQLINGNIVVSDAPTGVSDSALIARSAVPTNLGACIRSSLVLDFEPMLVKMGYVPPPGYKMLAAH